MTSLPPLYERLLGARDAFSDYYHYRAPSAALRQSQALVGTVNGLLDAFVLGVQALCRTTRAGDVKTARTELENVVEAYIIDIGEGIRRLEEQAGESGLVFYLDTLEQAMSGEIERCAASLQAQLSP